MILEKRLFARWKVMLAIIAITFVGCSDRGLSATRSSHVIYDQGRDEFAHLRLFRDIHVYRGESSFDGKPGTKRTPQEREADFDYLIALWKNRSDLIMSPEVINNYGESQILYVGPREYRNIDLEKQMDEKETKKSPVDLSTIIIRPGEFFASPEGGLCYFHRCYVPGTTVDEFLKAQLQLLNESLLDSLLEEQNKRKEMKGNRATWGDLRRTLFNDDTKSTDNAISQWEVLDSESIRLLIHQSSGRQLSLVRARDRIVLGFKLSKTDAAELETTKRAWDEKVKTMLANGKSIDAIFVQDGMELKTGSNGTVTVTINVPAMFPVQIPKGQRDEAIKTPETSKARAVFEQGARDDLATVKARGIPVSRSITVEKVLDDFSKGRKK